MKADDDSTSTASQATGQIAQHAGFATVLLVCLALAGAWLAVAWNMGDFVSAAAPAPRT